MKRRFLSAMASVMTLVFATVFFGCGNGGNAGAIEIEMVRIPAGRFRMGSNSLDDCCCALPAHRVRLTQGFYMSRHLVTQGQFQEVMGFNSSHFTAEVVGHDTSNFPVENVNWFHAIVFCNRLSIREGLRPAYEILDESGTQWTTNPDLWGAIPTSCNVRWSNVRIVAGSNGYRLPTEAQWEYAARARTRTPWNTGNSITQAQANFGICCCDGGRTSEVGSFPPNAWGLYDMHGNVFEWVWDWFGDYMPASQARRVSWWRWLFGLVWMAPRTDPMGPSSRFSRVFRGGSFISSEEGLRSANRRFGNPGGVWYNYLGFRVVRP